jgi:hypothetical protein
MDRQGKISKACEPCRRRKIRCNGQQPCLLCQQTPVQCTYRAKARDRASTRQRAAAAAIGNINENGSTPTRSQPPLPSATPPAAHTPKDHNTPADPEVYRGITATHHHGPDSGECAQLFYGPSSNFAFLQQLHKSILDYGRTRQPDGHGDHEGLEGLDTFVQRSIFFGTPSTYDATLSGSSLSSADALSPARAAVFLDKFKTVSSHLFPLFTDVELDQMLHNLYPEEGQITSTQVTASRQERALTLAVLAIGALSTDATDLAEVLYEQAKTVAHPFAEAVTLSMIQLKMLLADYQINIGRPNSAYLHLGDATRRALAMGLNREAGRVASDEKVLQKRRSTMWCLYLHERYCILCASPRRNRADASRWHSLVMGRSSALKFDDISCRYPTGLQVLMNLCELVRISEVNAEEMYSHKSESLQLLYVAAQRTHSQLRRFAEQAGIGSSDVGSRSGQYGGSPALHLHNGNVHPLLPCSFHLLICHQCTTTVFY